MTETPTLESKMLDAVRDAVKTTPMTLGTRAISARVRQSIARQAAADSLDLTMNSFRTLASRRGLTSKIAKILRQIR